MTHKLTKRFLNATKTLALPTLLTLTGCATSPSDQLAQQELNNQAEKVGAIEAYNEKYNSENAGFTEEFHKHCAQPRSYRPAKIKLSDLPQIPYDNKLYILGDIEPYNQMSYIEAKDFEQFREHLLEGKPSDINQVIFNSKGGDTERIFNLMDDIENSLTFVIARVTDVGESMAFIGPQAADLRFTESDSDKMSHGIRVKGKYGTPQTLSDTPNGMLSIDSDNHKMRNILVKSSNGRISKPCATVVIPNDHTDYEWNAGVMLQYGLTDIVFDRAAGFAYYDRNNPRLSLNYEGKQYSPLIQVIQANNVKVELAEKEYWENGLSQPLIPEPLMSSPLMEEDTIYLSTPEDTTQTNTPPFWIKIESTPLPSSPQ